MIEYNSLEEMKQALAEGEKTESELDLLKKDKLKVETELKKARLKKLLKEKEKVIKTTDYTILTSLILISLTVITSLIFLIYLVINY